METIEKIKHALRTVKDEEEIFKLNEGLVLFSLYDLVDALEMMTDEVYYHHVTNDRNDFETWIKDIFLDEHLAQRVHFAKNKTEMHEILKKRVLYLQHRLDRLTQEKEDENAVDEVLLEEERESKFEISTLLLGIIVGIIFGIIIFMLI
jgi:hypothetical protein